MLSYPYHIHMMHAVATIAFFQLLPSGYPLHSWSVVVFGYIFWIGIFPLFRFYGSLNPAENNFLDPGRIFIMCVIMPDRGGWSVNSL